jgi:hypothetical protein
MHTLKMAQIMTSVFQPDDLDGLYVNPSGAVCFQAPEQQDSRLMDVEYTIFSPGQLAEIVEKVKEAVESDFVLTLER